MMLLRLIVVLLAAGLVFPAGANAQPQTRPATYVRVYDVRDLVAPVRDFSIASSPYGLAFTLPSGAPGLQQIQAAIASVQGGGINVTNQLFGSGAAVSAGEKPGASIDELVKLIQDNIDTETWKDKGGDIGAIRAFHGSLIITQTRQTHEHIVQVLGDLAADEGGMIRVSADWLLLPSAEAAKLLKRATGQPVAEQAVQPLDPAVFQNVPAGAKHFSAETLSRNGQTVYVVSGLDRSVVTSTTPVVSTGVAAYSADVSNVGGGIALEVNSRVNWEQHTAMLSLHSTFSDPAQSGHDTVTIASAVTSQPGGPNQITQMPLAAGYQPISRIVQDMRTTVRVPLGVPVIVGGMTLQPDSKGNDEQQLLLILKVTASK